MVSVFIGIGSNLGDRRAHLAFAQQQLAALRETRLLAFSTVRETAPVGPVEMGAFLNAVAQIETELEPLDLLAELQEIERRTGRVRSIRWGPRTLDLDILLYGERIIQTPGLIVPHLELHRRPFVLEPLVEIGPDVRHPKFNKSAAELYQQCTESRDV
ncbi:MAG: 2-amino-4-hydroxy-6-hydroxymethyldihydropteridine diphosphokinase [Phycisphaeraceae bacterium]